MAGFRISRKGAALLLAGAACAAAARSAIAGSIAAAYRPRRMMPVFTPAG